MEALIALASAAGAEALKSWGSLGISVLLLGAVCWSLWGRLKTAADENKSLRAEVSRLQELRLQDAREMIRVAETGTTTIAARAEGDAQFRDLMRQLVMMLQFGARLPTPTMSGVATISAPPISPPSRSP